MFKTLSGKNITIFLKSKCLPPKTIISKSNCQTENYLIKESSSIKPTAKDKNWVFKQTRKFASAFETIQQK